MRFQLKAIKRLIRDAQAGDHFVFYCNSYLFVFPSPSSLTALLLVSGHGSQVPNQNPDEDPEEDGMDEGLLSCLPQGDEVSYV